MKIYSILIGLGILNGVIPISILILTGNDLRYLFVSAILLLFASGVISSRLNINPLLVILFLATPLIAGFSTIILSEIISFGYLIIPWIASLILGVFWLALKDRRFVKLLCSISLIIIVFFFNSLFIPQLMRVALSKELNEPSPPFEISNLDGSVVSSSEFKGKTIVLDFFGTHCGPCIQELPELKKVKDYFINRKDIVFLVVNIDQPGDSPEQVMAFKNKHDFGFDYFYDHGGKTHKLFGLSGVPSLAIIDKHGNIRFKKAGYNKSEGNFKEYMINLINEISK